MDLPLGYSFCIDTSALVDLKRWYGREVFHSLWKDVEGLIAAEKLVSPREVLLELEQYARADELLVWARKHRSVFLELDEEDIALAREIERRFPALVEPSKTTPQADPFVVALAKRKGSWVVTQEASGKGRLRIPDACQLEGVRCLNLWSFFVEQGWKY